MRWSSCLLDIVSLSAGFVGGSNDFVDHFGCLNSESISREEAALAFDIAVAVLPR